MLAIFALSLFILTQTTLASSLDDDRLELRDLSHLLDAEKRYAGKFAARGRKCTQDPIDLGLIIDSSASIYGLDFTKGLQFLASFLDEFDIGPGQNQVRVAAVSFGSGVYVEDGFNFTTYSNKQQMKEHLLNIPHKGGDTTDTGKALKYMRELQMSSRRSWAKQIQVVITDGDSDNGKETETEAIQTKESNIMVLAVGVKDDVRFEELLHIAGGVRNHVFRALSYDDLDEDFINQITLKTCTECTQDPIDLGLIIDSSASIYGPDFTRGLGFLASFLDEFDIGPGRNQVRVAAVSFGLGVYDHDGFNFTTYSNKQQVKDHVLKMPHRRGDITDTARALKYMRELQMEMRRSWAKQIEVVVTDGESDNATETAAEAMKTKECNIMVLAVGVKYNVKFKELLNIAGGVTTHIFRVPTYKELDEELKNELTGKTCTGTKPTAPPNVCTQDPIDLGLIIDSSSSIHGPDFTKGLQFLASILDEFDIGPGRNQVRVAAVSFGLGVHVLDGFTFDTYSNKQQVKDHVLNMPHRAGDMTHTADALKYMRELQMEMSRPWAKQVEVVLTDGESTYPTETAAEAMKTKESNIMVLAVGVKQDATFKELLNIAGGVRSHVFRAPSYDDLSEDFKNKITLKTCTDAA